MIGKSWKYKWLDFTDSVQVLSQRSNWYSYVLQDVTREVPLRTQTFERANFHWEYSSNTLAWSRIFKFTWKIIWTTKEKRHQALSILTNAIKPEWNPDIQNRWFYDLFWKTDNWEDRTCKAKVWKMLELSNDIDSPIIDFTFELYSETEKVYWTQVKQAMWTTAIFGWMTFPATLPTVMWWFAWTIEVENKWDWYAPCKIQVVWTATSPYIINLTNNNRYKINWTTTNLIIDNTNPLNDPQKLLVVTDAWVDIKAKRALWADIFLNPWKNYFVLLTNWAWENPTIFITWRDTYIF